MLVPNVSSSVRSIISAQNWLGEVARCELSKYAGTPLIVAAHRPDEQSASAGEKTTVILALFRSTALKKNALLWSYCARVNSKAGDWRPSRRALAKLIGTFCSAPGTGAQTYTRFPSCAYWLTVFAKAVSNRASDSVGVNLRVGDVVRRPSGASYQLDTSTMEVICGAAAR